MSKQTAYCFKGYGDQLDVDEDGTHHSIGSVDLPSGRYHVRNFHYDIIATVDKIEDAVPVLLNYYDRHPAPWKHDKPTEYVRENPISGELLVLQEPLGFWSVYRMQSQILLHDGRPAAFRTANEAKSVADAHAHDRTDERNSDGYSWFEMA